MFFGKKEDYQECPKCGYRFFVRPFPKVCPNPNCLQPLESKNSFADHIEAKLISEQQVEVEPSDRQIPIDNQIYEKVTPKGVQIPKDIKEIQVSSATASKQIAGVKVKKKTMEINLDAEIIVFPKSGIYFKNFGIVTQDRVVLYNRNPNFAFIQELSTNLDYIASSILGGEIDRLVLQSEISNAIEQILYMKEEGILYFAYGIFSSKDGLFILKEMKKSLKDALMGKSIPSLDKLDMANINKKMNAAIKFRLNQYINLSDILSEKEFTPVDEWIRFDYYGMSYRSIGTISKILGNDLPIDIGQQLPPAQSEDLKESLITAKIEAIAANTIANTNAVPKYLTVKLGYERYRYMIFEKLQNDYFMYMLAEGNLEKARSVVAYLKELVGPVTVNAFKGDLHPFLRLRDQIVAFFMPSNAKDDREGRIFN
jgi:DNA-directed RNA polymerase subunit RPC12/RpoP